MALPTLAARLCRSRRTSHYRVVSARRPLKASTKFIRHIDNARNGAVAFHIATIGTAPSGEQAIEMFCTARRATVERRAAVDLPYARVFSRSRDGHHRHHRLRETINTPLPNTASTSIAVHAPKKLGRHHANPLYVDTAVAASPPPRRHLLTYCLTVQPQILEGERCASTSLLDETATGLLPTRRRPSPADIVVPRQSCVVAVCGKSAR